MQPTFQVFLGIQLNVSCHWLRHDGRKGLGGKGERDGLRSHVAWPGVIVKSPRDRGLVGRGGRRHR